MAPPDQNKHKSNGDGDGDGDEDRAHPCDGSGGSASAVDQDHKACDEHTQGERRRDQSVSKGRSLPDPDSSLELKGGIG